MLAAILIDRLLLAKIKFDQIKDRTCCRGRFERYGRHPCNNVQYTCETYAKVLLYCGCGPCGSNAPVTLTRSLGRSSTPPAESGYPSRSRHRSSECSSSGETTSPCALPWRSLYASLALHATSGVGLHAVRFPLATSKVHHIPQPILRTPHLLLGHMATLAIHHARAISGLRRAVPRENTTAEHLVACCYATHHHLPWWVPRREFPSACVNAASFSVPPPAASSRPFNRP